MKYGPSIGLNVGSSVRPASANGAHNFERSYYKHTATGDVRAHYEDLTFTGTGGGEVFRVRGIVNGLLCATGATINAIHATGRVEAAKTVSGELNAIRATLEVAGTTPTPGGTLAAIQVDSNIVTGATLGAATAFIKVTDSGATAITNLFNITQTIATDTPAGNIISTHADHASTHLVKFSANGTDMWLLATNAH